MSLHVLITTTYSIAEDQERMINLYFVLDNLSKFIKNYNRDQRCKISSDHAIEIVNFFFRVVFNSSGATIVELMVKEYSKDNEWQGYESTRRYSGLATTHQAIRDIQLAYKAEEYILEKNKKTRRRGLRAMEFSIEFYHAYERGSGLLKGESPDANLVEYMEEEAFGPARGVTMKSRFKAMMAKQLDLDINVLPKKVLNGLFLFHLVSSFGPEILLLLQDNAMRL